MKIFGFTGSADFDHSRSVLLDISTPTFFLSSMGFGLFLRYLFFATKVSHYNLQPMEITSSLIFSENSAHKGLLFFRRNSFLQVCTLFNPTEKCLQLSDVRNFLNGISLKKQLIIFTSNELFHGIFVKSKLQKNLFFVNSEGNDFQNLLEKTFLIFQV